MVFALQSSAYDVITLSIDAEPDFQINRVCLYSERVYVLVLRDIPHSIGLYT